MKKFTPQNAFDKDENIKIKSLVANHSTPPHLHEFVELVYVSSGRGRHIINDRVYEVTKGDLLFINFGQTHSIVESDMVFVNILLRPEFMSENLVNSENIFDIFALSRFSSIPGEYNGLEMVSFRGSELAAVSGIIDEMIAEYNSGKSGYRTVIYGYMQVLFTMLIRKLREQDSQEYNKFISDITAYIDAHVFDRLTLSDIAADCFYNPSYFSRKFKEYYGKNLTSYIQEKRLERAVKLLAETDLSAEQICLDCGFGDKARFYKAFRKYYGTTPLQYRKSKK